VNFTVRTVEETVAMIVAEVTRRLEARSIPVENVVTPPVEFAGPIVQVLRFAQQDLTLRELYLNLLASAMESTSEAHPAFVDVLRQLSPLEGRLVPLLLSQVKARDEYPLVRILVDLGVGAMYPHSHLNDLRERLGLPSEIRGPQIDNMKRLGLIKVQYTYTVEDPRPVYDLIEAKPSSLSLMEAVRMGRSAGHAAFDRGLFVATDFGAAFARACLLPGGAVALPE
jgi:hypothetical protein